MTDLWLVRHGQTAWNAEGRYQGQNDIPLSELGKRQAQAVAQRLARERIDIAYASDLSRAWQTAAAIMLHQPAALVPEPGLRELNFGAWEGLTAREIGERFAESKAVWEQDPIRAVLPGGDCVREAVAQITATVTSIAARHADEQVLLVAHGGTFQLLLCSLLGIDFRLRRIFRFDNGSLSRLRLQPERTQLLLLNETSFCA